MSKPDNFRYPQALIRAGKQALTKKLKKVIGKVTSGTLNEVQGRAQGHAILTDYYTEQISVINEVVKEEGLTGLTGFESYPYEALTKAKKSWSKIISDTAALGR